MSPCGPSFDQPLVPPKTSAARSSHLRPTFAVCIMSRPLVLLSSLFVVGACALAAGASEDLDIVLTRDRPLRADPPSLALRYGPRLAAEPVRPPQSPLELVKARGQFVPGVQTEAFDGVLANVDSQMHIT